MTSTTWLVDLNCEMGILWFVFVMTRFVLLEKMDVE